MVKTHSVAEKMRLLELTVQIRMEIDHDTSSGKNVGQWLVSWNIQYRTRIFAGVPLAWASNDSGVVDDGNFRQFRWLLLRKL